MNDNGEERTDILVLIDEEGNEHDFAMVDRFQVNQSDYAILVPVLILEEGEEDEEVDFEEDAFIFRIDIEDSEEMLVEVEDEKEWQEVAAVWEDRLREYEGGDGDLY